MGGLSSQVQSATSWHQLKSKCLCRWKNMIKIASKTGFALRFLSTPWGMQCLILYFVRPCLALKREIIFLPFNAVLENKWEGRDRQEGNRCLRRLLSLKQAELAEGNPQAWIYYSHTALLIFSFKHMHTLTQKWGNESCRLLALTVQMDRAKAFLSRHESPVTLQRPTSRPIMWETRADTVSVLRWMS